jgi:hypothetical protein
MIEARSGKIPTTSVRRRISRLRRSLGLDQIWRHRVGGNAVKARISARAASGAGGTLGHRLATSGAKVLWLEPGDFLP